MSTSQGTMHRPNLPLLSSRLRSPNTITRIFMLFGQIILAAVLMFILPAFIHYLVHSIDEIYLLLGRTARSPFSSKPWTELAIGTVLLLAWHAGLGRISYLAIMGSEQPPVAEDDEDIQSSSKKTTGTTSWDRILARIIIPALLLIFAAYFSINLASRFLYPKTIIITDSSSNIPSSSED